MNQPWLWGLLALLPGSVVLAAGDGLSLPGDASALVWPATVGQPVGEADYLLSLRHFAGEGVPQDQAQGLAYLRKAAEAGHPEACFNLGNYYNLFAHQPEEAARWWRAAARSGHPEALHNLAEALQAGLIKPLPGESAENYRQPSAAASEVATQAPALAQPATANAQVIKEVAPAATGGPSSPARAGNWPSLPGDSATIQIFASTRVEEVRQMSRRHRFQRPLAVLSFDRGGEAWHALLYGQFADVPAARRALADLPAALRAGKPWARRLADVRAQSGARFEALKP